MADIYQFIVLDTYCVAIKLIFKRGAIMLCNKDLVNTPPFHFEQKVSPIAIFRKHFPSNNTLNQREITKILFNNNISSKDQWSLI
jgi:hypothetical protein